MVGDGPDREQLVIGIEGRNDLHQDLICPAELLMAVGMASRCVQSEAMRIVHQVREFEAGV